MSGEIVLNADIRVRTGTNKNREIRRNESMVPAVIYCLLYTSDAADE